MKPQFKLEEIYLDLSKLSEEQQRKAIALLPIDNISAQIYFMVKHEDWNVIKEFTYLFFNDKKVWQIFFSKREGKQELTYSQFLDMMEGKSEEILQVENYISIEELTKLCNDYNRNTLKITNLERDLEYKRSWSKESIAIKEIHKEVSHAQAIKENAKSKLQEIGIVF